MSAATPDGAEFARAMVPVALELLGEPTEQDDLELRFGTRGSLVVARQKGTWFDHEAAKGGGVIAFVQVRKSLDKQGALAWLHERGHIPKREATKGGSRREVAAYNYADETGTLLFQVVRFEPKDFRQRAPDGTGGWVWKMTGVRRVIYHLPDVIAAVATGQTIYVVEGEKAANALAGLGMIATCSPGGANKWRSEYGKPLTGAQVVVVPDNDLPGRQHAAAVAKALHGIAKTVRTLTLPKLPDKGDVADWIAAGGTAADLARLTAAIDSNGKDRSAERSARPTTPDADIEVPDWAQYLQRDEKEGALANLANAMTALRSAPELRDCFAFDQMARTTILVKPVPRGDADDLPRPVRDGDVGQVQEWMQRHDLRRIGRDTVHQAVDMRAEENSFHPVQDYLNSLRWDGTARLYSWLHTYLGAEANDYTAAIGQMFLIAMVARVFEPGCKADYMLILEGLQGALKSTVGAILGDKWFSDSLPDIGSDAVRISQHLRGKWLVELSELSAMSKAEVEELKAFLTRREEQFTPKYGRREVKEPRQCCFLGTTNKAVYLRDETGARRFWPVKVGTLKTDFLTRDRDQLFAEAFFLFRRGVPWWPAPDFEREHIRPQQEARYEADAWEQAIGEWLTSGQEKVTSILEVAVRALGMERAKLGTTDQRRITAALERLGWERGKRTMHGQQWVPGPAATKAPEA